MQSPPSYSSMPKPTLTPPTATSSGVQLAHDADILIRTYLPPSNINPPYAGPPLSRVAVCLPQFGVSPKEQSGFVRGYSDDLVDLGITQGAFLSFIDGLNLAITASPPLRVVSFAGQIIGFVPFAWAQISGVVITVSAEVSIKILSKTLTDRYLRAANKHLFKPRGLSVRICTTPAMLALVSGSESKTRSKLNKVGRGVGSVLLKLPLPPIASSVIHLLADKPPTITPTGREGDPINNPTLMRRLALTEGVALPLRLNNLPPPVKPKGVIDVMASWGVKFDKASEARSEKNNERRRRALQRITEAGVEPSSYSRTRSSPLLNSSGTSSSSVKNVASTAYNAFNELRLQREFAKEEHEQMRRSRGRRDGGLVKGMLGANTTRMERKVANADLLEHWATDKLLWIVIMSSDKDEEIADIAIADDPANEERVDDKTWKAQMERERDELEMDDMQDLKMREQAATNSTGPS